MARTNQHASLWDHDRGVADGRIGIIGVDEAGRGALAGPVVAGAVYLPQAFFEKNKLSVAVGGMNDSKMLTPRQREDAFARLVEWEEAGLIFIATGSASVEEIEAHNILGATRLAMMRALELLQEKGAESWHLERSEPDDLFAEGPSGDPDLPSPTVFLDGRPMKPFSYRHEALVRGDSRSLAIAMASIVAKVSRDRKLEHLAFRFSNFGFPENKGYGTAYHREQLLKAGPCRHHRKRFLRKIFQESPNAWQDGFDFDSSGETSTV